MKWLALLCLLLLPHAAAQDGCPDDPECEPDEPDVEDTDANEPDADGNETSEPPEDGDASEDSEEPDAPDDEQDPEDASNGDLDDEADEDADGDDDFDREGDDDEDDNEFDDDDDGFTDRTSGVRYSKADNRFQIAGQTRLDHQFLELLEFEDRDGDQAYDPGEPVLARIDLTRNADAVAGTEVKRITYLLETGALHLDVRNDGDATKFDVIIEGYGFQSATSRLAVASSITVDDGLRTGTIDGNPALVRAGAGAQPYLSWVPNVTVDGRDEAVAWSASVRLDEAGGSGILYWSYPQGEAILHDPRLGVASIPFERALDLSAFAWATAAAVAFLAITAVRRR
ncbi:MAG: hypothetical protein ACPHID_05490 [Thermoplasmatota archaeon]